MGNWNDLEDQILAAMREALAPRSNALVDQQFLRLQSFRRDPFSSSTAMESSRFSEILSEFPEWKEKVENFFQESQDRYKADCNRTLEVAAKGAQLVEVWANRLAFSIEIESVIDQHCPNPRSFASACAQMWLQYSLPVLPWILFWLLLPAMNGGTNAAMTNLGKVRKALERCDSADAMVQLRDAFVNACSLLLRTAWCQGRSDYAQAVSWLSSALVVTHDACQILLPDLPASAVAAALAAIPLDVRPQSPWETPPVEFADFVAPKMEELSQALAQAVHEEVKHWQAEGGAGHHMIDHDRQLDFHISWDLAKIAGLEGKLSHTQSLSHSMESAVLAMTIRPCLHTSFPCVDLSTSQPRWISRPESAHGVHMKHYLM